MEASRVPPAWVQLASESEVRELMAGGGPYDFGFLPAMARLIMAHDRIGPAFGQLFATIMFMPGVFDRREREMIAAVAAGAQDCFY